MRLVPAARADHQHGTRPVARADEHVVDPGRTVHEVPLAQRSLLAFEDHDALAVQHEKVLLHRLRVVLAVGLPRLHDLYVHAGVRPRPAVGLEVRLDQVKPQPVQERPDHRPGHPVAAVDDHPHRLDRRGVDELQRGLLELLVERDVLGVAAAGRVAEPVLDLGLDVPDARLAGQCDRSALDQLGPRVALRVVRCGAHQAAVQIPRADQVIEHLGPDLAAVEHGGTLLAHALAIGVRQLGRGQAHVAAQAEAQIGGRLLLELADDPRERPPDQLGPFE